MALDKNKIIAEATKLVQKGAFDKAIKAYEKVLADDPKDVRILLKIGELHQKKGDDATAAEAFEKVAETYGEQGFFLKAVAVYKQIVKLAPDDVRVNERLAALYQQLGLLSDAMGQLQYIAAAYEKQGNSGRLTEVLQRMVDLDPENIASSIKLGELQARGGQAAAALECFKRAAQFLKSHNRPDEYLKVAERIAVLTPDDLELTRELAHIYLSKGDTKRALAKLQACFKADPKEIETLQLLAQAFRDLGQTSKTLSVYKELAHVHQERGRAADARAVWRKVQELAPDDEDAAQALGAGTPPPGRVPAHAAATPLSAVTPPPPARPPPPASRAPAMAPPPPPRAVPAAALRPAPVAPNVPGGDVIPKLLTETDVYVKYGLHDKALDHLRKVLAIDPESPDAHEKVRELHVAAGRTAEAADAGARAVRALVARGQADRAKDALARLRQLAPSHPELAELSAATGGTGEVVLVSAEDEVVVEPEADGALGLGAADDDALALAAAGHEGDEIVDEDRPNITGSVEIVVPEDEPEAVEVAPETVDEAADEPLAPTPPPPARAARAIAPPPPPAIAPRPAAAKPAPARAPAAKPAAAARPAAVPPPAARPARTPPPEPDLSDELEEADFFLEQGLLDDARDALQHLLAAHPGHRAVQARLAEVAKRAGGAKKNGAAGREAPPATDESFDIARELAEELGGETLAPAADDEFQYSVEDVFNQFKKGVEQTVKPEDSATHYDLGIAYKEMALLDDAIQEFDTALRGNDKKREVDCLSMIGLCRMAKGEAKEAIRAFRRALASESLTRDAAKAIQYELGAAYEAAGDAEVGLWFLQRIAKADPSYRDLAARISALGGGPGRPPSDVRPAAARAPAARAPAAPPARPAPAPAAPVSGAKKNIGYL